MLSDAYYIRLILEQGSEEALFKLVKRYERQVFSLCYRVIRNREEAEEAAQDVFLKAAAQLKKLTDLERFAPWLMRIAYHRAIDYARLVKHKPVDLDEKDWERLTDEIERTPVESAEDMDRKALIEWVLQQLPAIDNAIITLHYLQGYSLKEVAEATNLSLSNVKVKLYRVRPLLKAMIEQHLGKESKDLL